MPDYTFSAGPEGGDNTAIQLSSTGSMTLPAVSLSGGSLFLWVNGSITLKIGDTPVSLAPNGTNGRWTLYYATGITATGAIKITGLAGTQLSDLRVFAGTISPEALLYYYNDITENSGAIVSP